MISVIVRTKNEEKWIGRCLTAISMQDYPNFEIILVDNDSADGTLDIISRFDCRVVRIPDGIFTHGRSLNMGIEKARGDFIAIISGHCIPLNNKWLDRLLMAFTEPEIAGAYGRQEPLPDTSNFDKRDLWTTFGLDKKKQEKDYFFHNANSMIRKSIWEQIPFNEELSGVEDRDWAKHVLERGYKIVYEPHASVYHHHGIHQGRDEARAARVVRVIELINNGVG